VTRETRWLRAQGPRLAVDVQGDADAPAVLFLHGLTMSRDTWQETIAALQPDFCCWALDFRGHGDSDHADSYGLPDYLEDARSALTAIGRPAFVVGHSLGGAVAGVLAQADPRVRAALLEDPPWFLGEPESARASGYDRRFEVTRLLIERLRRDQAPVAEYQAFLSIMPVGTGTAREHVSERHLRSRAAAMQRLDPATLSPVGPVLASLEPGAPFRSPVTILPAEVSPAFGPDHENRLNHEGAPIRVIRRAGADHTMHIQRQTEAWFIATVRQWLDTAE